MQFTSLLVSALLAGLPTLSGPELQGTNLALGKPVSASSFESDSYPHFAVDGDSTLVNWWGANPYPQWLEVDLQAVAAVERLHLLTYWGGGRHYQYTIEGSLDHASWDLLVDRSANTTPSDANGFSHDIAGARARFLRVNMLSNSANPGVHIVEFEALGTPLRPGEIEVVANGALQFGSQGLYEDATRPVEIEIRNVHTERYLSLELVELQGLHTGDFVIVSDTGETTLAPDSARVIEVAFDPVLPGDREALLLVLSNDEDEPRQSLSLTGRGKGPLLPLLPQATGTRTTPGEMKLVDASRIVVQDAALLPHAAVLAEELYLATGLDLDVKSGTARAGDIVLRLDPSFGSEEYELNAGSQVSVRGRDVEAVTRGSASLVQLVEPDGSLPIVNLLDRPDFAYRAVSVDVARKFHSIDVLKQMVEMCRFYKVRYLGLHITDDQNFMFPSTAFPNLDQNNADRPAYSIAELQDLERYARDRGVFLVPELDVPGHSAKMVQLYPQVFGSLSGGTIDFRLPSCVAGVKTIISEMLAVFSSTPLFHIGGDESGFSHLPEFPGFVSELNDHVKANVRRTLMWEGFSAGTDIPLDILILNWESSYYRPDAMLQDGYTVINAGWDPLYVVDHYPWVQYTHHTQERIFEFEPFTFGHVAPGYPATNGISVSPTSHVPGAEMCWWEGRGDYAVPILRNRVAPFAARLWNHENEMSFASFQARFATANARLESILFPVNVSAPAERHDFWKPERHFAEDTTLEMRSARAGTIHYTLDGSEPTEQSPTFEGPVPLTSTATVKAALFESGARVGFTTRVHFSRVLPVANLTTGKRVASNSPEFIEHRPELAVDGIIDPDAYWSCFPNPARLTIDLGGEQELDGVTIYSRWGNGYYERYFVELSSDGDEWTQVVDFTANSQPASAAGYAHHFPSTRARYLRLNTTGNSWFPGGRFPRIVEVLAHETP